MERRDGNARKKSSNFREIAALYPTNPCGPTYRHAEPRRRQSVPAYSCSSAKFARNFADNAVCGNLREISGRAEFSGSRARPDSRGRSVGAAAFSPGSRKRGRPARERMRGRRRLTCDVLLPGCVAGILAGGWIADESAICLTTIRQGFSMSGLEAHRRKVNGGRWMWHGPTRVGCSDVPWRLPVGSHGGGTRSGR